MKHYMFIFLLFWFNSVFAPNIVDIKEQRLDQKTSELFIQPSKQEIASDEEDVKTLTHLKMLNKFTKQNRAKVRVICSDLGIKTKWLYKAIWAESKGNTNAINPYTNASGLIGFMPSTALALNTTIEEIQQMNIDQQLDYVHKYFKKALKNKKMHKASDVYLAMFSPLDLHKHDSTIIGKTGKRDISKKVYKQNKILDMNKDSIITIEDVNLFVSTL